MIVSIHQPAYLPWLGYFDKIARSNLFIWLDTVQFQKSSFQNRNRILSHNGPLWLTVPVRTAGVLYDTPLNAIEIDNTRNWQSKHAAALSMNYGRAQCFADRFQTLATFYGRPWRLLDDLCWQMLGYFNGLLGISTPIRRASDITVGGSKSDLVLNLCKAVGATTYLSGALGRNYLVLQDFAAAGIAVEFQDYASPVYRQVQPGFTANLAIVDLIFNESDPHRVLEQKD